MYKSSHYEYSSSSNGITPSQADLQKNINSLDTLLLDLKHERDASLDRGLFVVFYELCVLFAWSYE